jgi:hypothetical protein
MDSTEFRGSSTVNAALHYGLALVGDHPHSLWVVGNIDGTEATRSLNVKTKSRFRTAYEDSTQAMRLARMVAELSQNVCDWAMEHVARDLPPWESSGAQFGLRTFTHQGLLGQLGVQQTQHRIRVRSPVDKSLIVEVSVKVTHQGSHLSFLQFGAGQLDAIEALVVGVTTKKPTATDKNVRTESGVFPPAGPPLAGGHGVGLKQLLVLCNLLGVQMTMTGTLPSSSGFACSTMTNTSHSETGVVGLRGQLYASTAEALEADRTGLSMIDRETDSVWDPHKTSQLNRPFLLTHLFFPIAQVPSPTAEWGFSSPPGRAALMCAVRLGHLMFRLGGRFSECDLDDRPVQTGHPIVLAPSLWALPNEHDDSKQTASLLMHLPSVTQLPAPKQQTLRFGHNTRTGNSNSTSTSTESRRRIRRKAPRRLSWTEGFVDDDEATHLRIRTRKRKRTLKHTHTHTHTHNHKDAREKPPECAVLLDSIKRELHQQQPETNTDSALFHDHDHVHVHAHAHAHVHPPDGASPAPSPHTTHQRTKKTYQQCDANAVDWLFPPVVVETETCNENDKEVAEDPCLGDRLDGTPLGTTPLWWYVSVYVNGVLLELRPRRLSCPLDLIIATPTVSTFTTMAREVHRGLNTFVRGSYPTAGALYSCMDSLSPVDETLDALLSLASKAFVAALDVHEQNLCQWRCETKEEETAVVPGTHGCCCCGFGLGAAGPLGVPLAFRDIVVQRETTTAHLLAKMIQERDNSRVAHTLKGAVLMHPLFAARTRHGVLSTKTAVREHAVVRALEAKGVYTTSHLVYLQEQPDVLLQWALCPTFVQLPSFGAFGGGGDEDEVELVHSFTGVKSLENFVGDAARQWPDSPVRLSVPGGRYPGATVLSPAARQCIAQQPVDMQQATVAVLKIVCGVGVLEQALCLPKAPQIGVHWERSTCVAFGPRPGHSACSDTFVWFLPPEIAVALLQSHAIDERTAWCAAQNTDLLAQHMDKDTLLTAQIIVPVMYDLQNRWKDRSLSSTATLHPLPVKDISMFSQEVMATLLTRIPVSPYRQAPYRLHFEMQILWKEFMLPFACAPLGPPNPKTLKRLLKKLFRALRTLSTEELSDTQLGVKLCQSW